MKRASLHHRGRDLAAAVVGALAAASVGLTVLATLGHQGPPSPPPSAAVDEIEGDRTPASREGLGPKSGDTTSRTAEETAVVGPTLRRSRPVRLDIPQIGLDDAKLMELGLTEDGSIEVPPADPDSKAGWFRHSPSPGELGPSVILGHVDSAKAGPAVFYSLGELRPGSEVRVTREDGIVAVFLVEGVEQYSKSSFPTTKVLGDVDHAALRLLTCGGDFDRAQQSYKDNIVVYARLIRTD